MDLKDLLSRERDFSNRRARVLLDALVELWDQQADLIKAGQRAPSEFTELGSLKDDLTRLHHWLTQRRPVGA